MQASLCELVRTQAKRDKLVEWPASQRDAAVGSLGVVAVGTQSVLAADRRYGLPLIQLVESSQELLT